MKKMKKFDKKFFCEEKLGNGHRSCTADVIVLDVPRADDHRFVFDHNSIGFRQIAAVAIAPGLPATAGGTGAIARSAAVAHVEPTATQVEPAAAQMESTATQVEPTATQVEPTGRLAVGQRRKSGRGFGTRAGR